VAFQTPKVEAFEPAARFTEGLITMDTTEQQWQRDVLLGRELRHQLAELEHETEAITPQSRPIRFPHGVESLTVEMDLTGDRNEDASQAVEQCRLT
jgi:hypothetical protein